MVGKYLKTSILFVFFLMVTQVAIGQSFTLQGKVSDKDGNPIELASVMVAPTPTREADYARSAS